MKGRIDFRDLAVPVLSVIAALLIGAIILLATGKDPLLAYSKLISSAFGGMDKIGDTLRRTTPLILTGLAVAIPFRAGLFNIGGQGQFVVGLIAAALVGLYVGGLPQLLHMPLALLAAALAGGMWAAMAGIFKTWRGAHEVITTIMLNYIALYLGRYLLGEGHLLQRGSDVPESTKQLPESVGFPVIMQLSPVSRIHFGIIIALAVAAAVYFLIKRTTVGYEIRAVGLNPDAAEYGGVNVSRTVTVSMLLGGACAAMAGASILVGDLGRLSSSSFDDGVGFMGIAVALLGRANPVGIVFAALLFGALDAGGGGLGLVGISNSVIEIVQGLIVLFVGMDLLFRQYVVNRFFGSPA